MTQLELQPSPPAVETATATASSRLPNFLYLGTSKAGSTWIYHVLADHPQVFMAPAKGAYYFDHHWDRGLDWYREHFRKAREQEIVGEISHSYLFSPEAIDRIAEHMPDGRLMVCLRDPIERAFSAYFDLVKNGRFAGTFEEALEADPDLKQRGSYGTYLSATLERFPLEQIHTSIFDDLKADPQAFANDLFDFLSISTYDLTPAQRKKMMPAARPRSRWLSRMAKAVARRCERIGLRAVRGRAKRSRLVRNLLYRPLASSELPSMNPATRDALKQYFRPEIRQLDALLGTQLCGRWNLE